MKTKYSLFLLIAASLLLIQCKKDVTDCTDTNASNYNADADINCCCEYLITFDAEGTGNEYQVTWLNESGTESTLSPMTNTWGAYYVVPLGTMVSFSVTNLNTDSTTTAIANIWKGDVIFRTATVTGTGETATVSGIVN
ncbi:MAG TPA: hypothetical protein EYN71_06435 [Flavobacteriales bacterium]|nr:hypothetical protein [Flavobacteriales bacterium]HIO67570.1 hypothetical protein [Flavobacteriales bacterium]